VVILVEYDMVQQTLYNYELSMICMSIGLTVNLKRTLIMLVFYWWAHFNRRYRNV